ncbi:MAG: putative membrane protein [Bacteroidia bacterium]|jgi:uncharacterized membrane protein
MRDVMLILHFIGLVMGIGNGFAHLFLGLGMSKMSNEESVAFTLRTFAVNKMGYIGLFLLVVSGGYLMTPYWDTLMSNYTLLVKLTLFVVLVMLIVMMNGLTKTAIEEGGGSTLHKIQNIGKITLPLGVIIVVLAVLTFH